MATNTRTGFIGLGAMGAPIAANLAAAGLLHRVWNRTHDKALAFAEAQRTTPAASPAELARDCELIMTCVADGPDMLEVVEQLAPGITAGTTVIDLSTTSVEAAREAGRLVEAAGGDFLDAPVSGGVEGAAAATLVMMIGGERRAFERARPALKTISAKQLYMGGGGSGQAAKAVNQVMAAGINQAVTEALAFGQALGIDMDRLIDALSSGAASSWFVQHRGPSLLAGDYERGFKLSLHQKDLAICQQLASSLTRDGKKMPLVEMTRIHYQRLIDSGHGDKDISCLYLLKQELFGLAQEGPR